MKPRQLSVVFLLLALFTLTACSPVGDKITLVNYDEAKRTFRRPASDDFCYAEIGSTVTILKTYKGSSGGCCVSHIPEYYMEYSNAGVQEFRTKYGQLHDQPAERWERMPCTNRDLLIVDERNFDELREHYERFLDDQKERERHAAFEKKLIEEHKQKNQAEKE